MSVSWVFRARNTPSSHGAAFALGIFLVVLSLALHYYIDPTGAAVIVFVPAILLTATVGGLWAGLLTTLLSCLFSVYFLLPPYNAFKVVYSASLTKLVTLAVAGVFIAVICDLLRKTLQRSEAAKAELAQALKTSNQLAAIVESSNDAIFTKTLDGIITSCNNAAQEMFGYTADELVGQPITILFPPDRIAEEDDLVAKLGAGKKINHYETVRVRKDGTTIDVSVALSPVRNETGRIVGVSKTVRNITEKKHAEQALRESLDRLERVLDNETVGVMFWDLNTGAMVDANDTFLRLMGYSRSDVEARELFWQKLTPPEYFDVSRAEVEKFLATGRVGPYEKEYFCKDGSRKWLLFAGSSLGNNQCVEFCVDISDRKKVEAALVESERQFRTLANAIPTLCWTAKADGFIDWYNDRWYQYTGTTPEQMEGWGWQSVHDTDVLPEVMERWTASIATGQPFEMVFPLRRADGVFRPFLTRVTPVLDRAGNVARWFGTNTDVTEQKRAEDEIRSARAKLMAAMTSMADGMFICDLAGNFTHLNEAFAKFHRFSTIEECQQTLSAYPAILDVFTPDGQELPFDQWPVSRALRGETALGVELRLRRKDTGESWFGSYNFAAIRDADGRIVGVIGTMRDETEKLKAEQELRRSEEQYRTLYENLPDGFAQMDMNGRIMNANAEFCRMIGYAPDELQNLTYGDITPEHWRSHEEAILANQVLTRGFSDIYEKEYRRKDGTIFPVELRTVVTRDSAGNPESMWTVVRDISERKASEARVRHLRDELSHVTRTHEMNQISAGLAHELNQPLAAILNYANVAKRISSKADQAGKIQEILARVADQATRAASVIQKMRAIVERREAQGGVESINAVVEDSLEFARVSGHLQRVITRLELAPDDPSVIIDRVQIQQVLVNLLRNAAEAMRRMPTQRITVSTAVVGGNSVDIAVADTGPGIPPEVAEGLFQPFVTTKGEGLGLGLMLSREIVEAHGGQIRAESNGDCGTVFHVTLPLAKIH